MSREISPNKVNDDQKRRAEHIENKLEKQGIGEDEAEKRALEMAVDEVPGGYGGGGNTGGEPKKQTAPGDSRNGSQKQEG